MGKKKVVTSKAVEQEEVAPIVEQEENVLQYDGDESITYDGEKIYEDGSNFVTKDEVAAGRYVAKKKGLSSFGAMLKAAGAKRKERKKMYGKEN